MSAELAKNNFGVAASTYPKQVDSRSWPGFLADETERLAETGTRGAVLSFHVEQSTSAKGRPIVELVNRFLEHWLRPTDRFATLSFNDFVVLHTPAPSFKDLVEVTTTIEDGLMSNQFDTGLGYAMQRANEALNDTQARADAQVHRLLFRRELSGSGLLLR